MLDVLSYFYSLKTGLYIKLPSQNVSIDPGPGSSKDVEA